MGIKITALSQSKSTIINLDCTQINLNIDILHQTQIFKPFLTYLN